jgi:CelD/BcsL family acetyltransferase involved in cellulose biosynthesis
MAHIRFAVVSDESAFAGLRPEWNALLGRSRANSLFLTWEWQHTWWRHLSAGGRLHILTVRDGGVLVGLAPCLLRPMGLASRQVIPRLALLGSGDVGSDYLDVILDPGADSEAREVLRDGLARQRVVLDFPRLGAQAAIRAMAGGLEGLGWTSAMRAMDVCPYIPMTGRSWDSYLAGLGAHHRYNFRRRLRRLERDHGLRWERVLDEAQRRRALATLIRLHNARWAGSGGSTAFHSKSLCGFHEAITSLALEQGWLRLFVLWVGDTPAAALYGFSYGSKFYFYQTGFDIRFRELSVGLVAMGLAIREAFDEHLDEFDLLHGAEAYKVLWTSDARPIGRLELFPPRWRGVVYRAAIEGYRKARHAARLALEATRPHARPASEVVGVRHAAVVTSPR